ncbi:hypothetical protein BZG36_00705 [Bifiguratus adelaidae]|uniref:Ubiquitin carboxyl-terminal hydrolase n=1 Tax=Bifiguratus adelaidae TaxID=1938954 RepID=A0A261Y6S4_9FUNG|nr:hypothetical protein BZG36_00705 [Bifiguratus adelaidae]
MSTSEPHRLRQKPITFGRLSREDIDEVMSKATVITYSDTIPFFTGTSEFPKRSRRKRLANQNTAHPNTTYPSSATVDSSNLDENISTSQSASISITNTSDITIANHSGSIQERSLPYHPLPDAPKPEVAAPPKPKPSSWAALFNSGNNSGNRSVQSRSTSGALPNGKGINGTTGTSTNGTTKLKTINDVVANFTPTFEGQLLQPRGLVNNGNSCYMNVILQPLSHCAPFYNLIKTVSDKVPHNFKSRTPVLDAMIEFLQEIRPAVKNSEEEFGDPLLPEYVYDALRGQKRFDSMKGRQEDCEEFLCYLLDALHEEMVAASRLKGHQYKIENAVYEYYEEQVESTAKDTSESITNGGNEDEWLEVGSKGRTSAMRSTNSVDSPISRIFGGKIRSVLRCPGAKDSVNLEPFQSLAIDIQPDHVQTVEDAVANMTSAEVMHDYVNPKGQRVDATKQFYIESAPPVLILHLKRFIFDNVGGVQKSYKPISFSEELVIEPHWISASQRTGKPLVYKLFGVVYHHGKSASGGHYTCDIRRQNGEWLNFDDTTITHTTIKDVTKPADDRHWSKSERNAYLLFYMRQS